MDTLSHYPKAIMQDTTLTVLEALQIRNGLAPASSTIGLTSVKLHRVRRALASELELHVAAITEARERAALREGDALKVLDGKIFIDTLTPAFEIDPTKAVSLDLELIPLYTAEITIRSPLFTASDAGWIRVPDGLTDAQCQLFGASMDAFTEKNLAA